MDWKKTERIMVPLLVLAGMAFRLIQLPFSCIWLDEAFSIKLAREPLVEIVRMISSDNGSPLFYFLLHGWMRLVGDGEYALTVLTVLLDCAALLAVPFLLRELFSDARIRITGTCAAAFCLPCLHQATNLRYYSLLVLCTVTAWLFFYRALHRGRRVDGLLFVLCSMAGFYTHTFYLFVPLSQLALLALFYRSRLRAGFMVTLFLLAGMALWLPSLSMQVAGYLEGATPVTVPELSRYPGSAAGAYLFSFSAHFLAVNSMIYVRLAAAAAVWLFALFHLVRERGSTCDARHARELFIAHLLSVGAMALISLVKPVLWLDKSDLIGLPLVCGLIGYAVSRFRFPAAALFVLLTLNLAGASRYTGWRMTERLTEDRDVIRLLAGRLTADDVLVQTGISHFTTDYYLQQTGAVTGPRYVFPSAQMSRPSCIDLDQLLADREELAAEADALVQALKQARGAIYVFRSPYEGLEPLYTLLAANFRLKGVLPVRQHPWGPIYTQIEIFVNP
jgi:hypothetical protein